MRTNPGRKQAESPNDVEASDGFTAGDRKDKPFWHAPGLAESPEIDMDLTVRCDSCGAEALSRLTHESWKAALTLCGHHANAHAVAAQLSGARIAIKNYFGAVAPAKE